MKDFLKDENPELYVTNTVKREKEKDKREKLKYTSGFASEMQTDEVISSPSGSSVTSTRGAEGQYKKSIADYYSEAALKLNRNQRIYCINVDVCSVEKYKGRRGLNVDVFFEPNSLPIKYKIDMVEREFKYEIFRDRKPHHTASSWGQAQRIVFTRKSRTKFFCVSWQTAQQNTQHKACATQDYSKLFGCTSKSRQTSSSNALFCRTRILYRITQSQKRH